jgi:hypothetical protein
MVEGVRSAGEAVQRVEIERGGKVVVFTGKPVTVAPSADTSEANEWDTVR